MERVTNLKKYQTVAGYKLSVNKSVSMQLGTWRSGLILSDGTMGRWTVYGLNVLESVISPAFIWSGIKRGEN